MTLLRYDMGEGVTAFSTLREGGAGKGEYASFNVTHYCGDDPEAVRRNRDVLCRTLGIQDDCLVVPEQVHHVDILTLQEDWRTMPETTRKLLLKGKDALMTDVPGLCIGVSTADCIPMLLYDPVRRAVCAVHAGWRGTVRYFAKAAVEAMQAQYGSEPSHLRAVIGPGISLQHFEVGDEVYQAFAEAGFPMEAIAVRKEKWHIDLWKCNQLQLLQAGLAEEHVRVAGCCSYDDPARWFSARRQGIRSGRIYTGIMLH